MIAHLTHLHRAAKLKSACGRRGTRLIMKFNKSGVNCPNYQFRIIQKYTNVTLNWKKGRLWGEQIKFLLVRTLLTVMLRWPCVNNTSSRYGRYRRKLIDLCVLNRFDAIPLSLFIIDVFFN